VIPDVSPVIRGAGERADAALLVCVIVIVILSALVVVLVRGFMRASRDTTAMAVTQAKAMALHTKTIDDSADVIVAHDKTLAAVTASVDALIVRMEAPGRRRRRAK
jgi:FtsZ-interacting cell division protein ZipA